MMVVRSYLAPSAIEGLGVFAAAPIAKGEIVWRFDPRFDQVISKDAIAAAPEPVREFLERYVYEFHADPSCVVLDGDEGRYMNHADDPNIDMSDPDVCVATRDIAAGEELTCDYRALSASDGALLPPRAPVFIDAPALAPVARIAEAARARPRRDRANGAAL